MSSSALYAEAYSQLGKSSDEGYPPLEDRPYPERYTGDFFRDSLPDVLFKLEQAAVKGDCEWAHSLIEMGADKNAALDKEGKTALMIACSLGWIDLVKQLVEVEDVDIDGPMSKCGFRAVDYAGKAQFRWPNDIEIADYLLSKGSQYTWWGAAFSGDIRRLETYLQNGQDINEINPVLWNYNAMDCAIHGGCSRATGFLAARGGLVQMRNCHLAVVDEMLWSIGRGDAFMYKEWGLEEGKFFKF
mmetsp:Transcript_10768/g.18894  ORF Transcript_10768/g.18894 Transcript_10768/m.18894 type:complete len:244 (-) Transcript_10768:46-777(-)